MKTKRKAGPKLRRLYGAPRPTRFVRCPDAYPDRDWLEGFEDVRTAYHEAGHAVMNAARGIQVGEVWMFDPERATIADVCADGNEGAAECDSHGLHSRYLARDEWGSKLLSALAGEQAEALLTGWRCLPGECYLAPAIRESGTTATDDYTYAQFCARLAPNAGAEVQRARTKARRILRRLWPYVETLAAALLSASAGTDKRKRLPAATVRVLLAPIYARTAKTWEEAAGKKLRRQAKPAARGGGR